MAYIYKRGKYFWVGYVDGGVPRQRSLRVTSKAAANTLRAEYELLEAKQRHRSKALHVKVPVRQPFDEYVENLSRERTKLWYERARDRFLDYCEARGIRHVSDVTAEVAQGFYNERRATSPGGARANARALKAVFGYAVKRGYVHENTGKMVKVEKPVRKLFRDLSFEEMERLLAAARVHGPGYFPLFATAYFAGLRASELTYLEAGDVDFGSGNIVVRSKPENLIKDHQERKIPLNGKLRRILREAGHGKRWFFETPEGNPRKNNLNRELKRLGRLAGVEVRGLCVQVLRETFGSHLRRRGVDIALISQYMGHSSIDVTLRHYAHIPIEMTHDEIDKL